MDQRNSRQWLRALFASTAILAACGVGPACNLVIGIDHFTTDPDFDPSSNIGIPCVTEADCPGPTTECSKRACIAGTCAIVVAADGTAVTEQIASDCKRNQCDGMGNRVDGVLDTTDVVDDGKECTIDACSMSGQPTNVPAAASTKCAMGKMVCDGYGSCVECATNSDCTTNPVCSKNHCVPQLCVNGSKDGQETDIDCGGANCQPCADAMACVVDSDCQSQSCAMMICAQASCTDSRTNGNETGKDCGGDCDPCPDGSGCLVGTDCESKVCSANKCQFATCTDMVQNGNEVHTDCGGSCVGCGVGATCTANADCGSEFCLQGMCTKITQVVTGSTHACAIVETQTGNGKIYCWGGNNYGELGVGTPGSGVTQPKDTVNLDNVTSISTFANTGGIMAVGGHTCARTVPIGGNPAFSCWGRNDFGQLGNSSISSSVQPVAIKFGAGVTATQVIAGGRHTCAITANGHVQCWGSNGQGQVGVNNTTSKYLTPISVTGSGVPNPIHGAQLALGTLHTCVRVTTTDNIFCWGSGTQGQLGLGNANSQIYPRKLNFSTAFTQLSAGQDFTCGLTGTDLYCWGDNSDGQLSTGPTTITAPVKTLDGLGVKFLPLSLGASGADLSPDANGGHSCFILADGKLVCLGLNNRGQLGIDNTMNTSMATDVTIPPVNQIALGTQFSCALLEQGALRCWGRNDQGQLGIGTTDDHSTPQPVKWPTP